MIEQLTKSQVLACWQNAQMKENVFLLKSDKAAVMVLVRLCNIREKA